MYNIILPTITGRLLRKRFHISQARGRFALFYRGRFMGNTDSFYFLRLMARGTWMIPYTSEDEAEFD
jgi:hypothetical protein